MTHTRAQESSRALERIYVTMRHLFNRGFYKPGGISGDALLKSLLTLSPEIYGSMTDIEKVELDGMVYVLERLPMGIEECRYIHFTSEEGYEKSFNPIIPQRRRNYCFRIDAEQMNIQITHGRSDLYDMLSHLTFLFNESEKIMQHAMPKENVFSREWKKIEELVVGGGSLDKNKEDIYISYLAVLLGRSYEEVMVTTRRLATKENPYRIFHIIYHLGRLSIEESTSGTDREISFSSLLRERIGHHVYGSMWAAEVKKILVEKSLEKRPLHIISANMHSVMNTFYAADALSHTEPCDGLYVNLSLDENSNLRSSVKEYALKHGMTYINDSSGANIDVQIFDCSLIPSINDRYKDTAIEDIPVILVIDYAFGEQAYEIMDELLRPIEPYNHSKLFMDIKSISIMGKAGILCGKKGEIMIPTAHIFEGTADNYPFENALKVDDFNGCGIPAYQGPMISVLGTSLQNKDILEFFMRSSWRVIGLEMEGAHYQKAIQAHSRIRGNISSDVVLRYAYYASDCPLDTSTTLAQGPMGVSGVSPTYLITRKIIEQIISQ